MIPLLLLALWGCGRAKGDAAGQPSPVLGAPAVAPPPIDVARAAREPAELLRAVLVPQRDVAGALGPHRVRGTAKLRVAEQGREVEALDEETLVEHGAEGAFHALYKNSRDYGREAYFAGGTLWIRPQVGKFHRRPPTAPEEPGQIVNEIAGTLGADLELVGHALQVADGGEASVAGRPARRVVLSLGSPRPRPPEKLPQRAWRDGLTVKTLEGEVALDAATGAVLEGRLVAEVLFSRDGHTYQMRLEATQTASDVGGAVAVVPPPDSESVDTPGRTTEFEDRQHLLQGIGPPARRAPTPGESR